MKTAIAIGAHPDDIEFGMAGTLLMLKRAGWEIHYLNIANGSCGSRQYSAARTVAVRRKESQTAAELLGAVWHPPFVNDLEILYEVRTLRRVAAVLREVKPSIVLTHSPQDYMEDHMNACRLAVTAAFTLGMPNFKTLPSREALEGEVTLYHALPHGLRDGLRRRIIPGAFVNTTPVHAAKIEALGAHKSQQDWLESSQKMNRYLQAMDQFSREVGGLSRRFKYAEGWRRHLHLGFCSESADPLKEALGRDYLVNKSYEAALQSGL